MIGRLIAAALGVVIGIAPAAADDAVQGELRRAPTATRHGQHRPEKRVEPRERRPAQRQDRTDDDRLERMREREKGMEDDE